MAWTGSRKNAGRGALGVLAAMALAGCASTPPVQAGHAVAEPMEELGQSGYMPDMAVDYALRPADVLSVTVFREPDLSLAQTPIAADGNLSLPLLGSMRVAGMTPQALENQIERLLGERYLRDPQVTVNVVSYGSHRVTVEGQVEEPGVYEFQPGTRLSGAIALAQGPNRTARLDDIAVFRPSADGMTVAKFDYRSMQAGTMLDPVLVPGDRVVVGTDGLSRLWQDVLRAIPVFALFSNANL